MNTSKPKPYNLDGLADGHALTRLAETIFSAPLTAQRKIGQGFYAQVYEISLPKAPHTAIVKCHLYPGRAAAEAQQLALLREYALVQIPQVYATQGVSADFPCEAIIMEYLPGVNASQIEFPDDSTRQAFANTVIENLRSWHAVHNEQGFGELDGPFFPTWQAAYGQKVQRWHAAIQPNGPDGVVSAAVMRLIDRSYDLFEGIFAGAARQSSLVHSDYNAWNMLIDPASYRLTGVIDPIDAGWSDPEIDLFHLANGCPDWGLLACYLAQRMVDDDFWMRYYFYRFWDDIKHYLRMGWYQEARFVEYGQALDDQIDKCLMGF